MYSYENQGLTTTAMTYIYIHVNRIMYEIFFFKCSTNQIIERVPVQKKVSKSLVKSWKSFCLISSRTFVSSDKINKHIQVPALHQVQRDILQRQTVTNLKSIDCLSLLSSDITLSSSVVYLEGGFEDSHLPQKFIFVNQ